MIKYLNSGEIASLKNGFLNTLRLKKLSKCLQFKDFIEGKVSFDTAVKIFYKFISLPSGVIFPGFFYIMLNYLLSNKILDNSDYEKLNKYFFDGSDSEDYQEFIDYVCERRDSFELVLKKLGNKYGVDIKAATFCDIYYDQIDDIGIFELIQKDLHEYVGIDSETDINEIEDEEERESLEYSSNFMEDATIFVLTNFELNESELKLMESLLDSYTEGILSEAWVYEGKTYITIADGYFLDNTSCILIIVLALFISKKKN